MESFVAHGALVRFFHTMCEFVILVVALLVKSLAAVFARVRLVPRVYPRMRIQRRAPVERLAANSARVRLFFGVYDLVAAQRGRLPETFAAHLYNPRIQYTVKYIKCMVQADSFNVNQAIDIWDL